MFNFALKSLWTRKVTTILFSLALIVVLVVSMLAVNIYKQVEEGLFSTDGQYDIVIGKRGSATTLVMSTLFFSADAIGTIPYSEYLDLATNANLATVIPMAMGDSYQGSNIVGTSPDLIKDKKLKSGRLFLDSYEATIGYNVAKQHGLKVGDEIISSHGLGNISHDHKSPYHIVGILDKTNSTYDNVVYTAVDSLWASHGIASGTLPAEEHAEDAEHVDEEAHAEDAEHVDEEVHEDEKVLTAVVVRSENMLEANKVINHYKGNEGIQALNPTQTLRALMENLDLSRQVAQILCSIILILAFILIAIMTVVMFESNKKDVQTLRFIGIKRPLVAKFVYYQTFFLLTIGVIVSTVLSRVALYFTNRITSNMGIVLDVSKVYSLEYFSVAGVVIICILPVILQLRKLTKEMV